MPAYLSAVSRRDRPFSAVFASVAPVGPAELSAWFNAQWVDAPNVAILARHAFSQAVGGDTTLDHPIWSLVHEFRFSLGLPFVAIAVQRWGLHNVSMLAGAVSVVGLRAATADSGDASQHYGGFLFVGGSLNGSIALTFYFSTYFLAGMALAMKYDECRCAGLHRHLGFAAASFRHKRIAADDAAVVSRSDARDTPFIFSQSQQEFSMATPQGFTENRTERLPMPAESELSEVQRAAAEAIVKGPRKAIFGPFIPLLQKPLLMERLGDLGAILRFESGLPDRLRELVISATARATDNQFEWQTHAPLALKAGVAQTTLDALASRRATRDLPADEAAALDVVAEILRYNGLSDSSFSAAEKIFGGSGVVELTVLIGYFATICWVMNVARTPGPGTYPALQATPA